MVFFLLSSSCLSCYESLKLRLFVTRIVALRVHVAEPCVVIAGRDMTLVLVIISTLRLCMIVISSLAIHDRIREVCSY